MSHQRRTVTTPRFLFILFLCSLTLCLWLGQIFAAPGQAQLTIPQSPTPSERVQQGVDYYNRGDFTRAIEQWQTALTAYQQSQNLTNTAIVLENLARTYQQIGQLDTAINYWEQVTTTYRQLGDMPQVGRILTEQAQAYSRFGQHRQAIALLCGQSIGESDCAPGSALHIAQTYHDQLGEAAALGSLGEAYRLRGAYNQAIPLLETSLNLGTQLDHSAYQISALNSLGNAYSSLAKVNYYRENSANTSGDTIEAEQFRQQALNDDAKALEYFQHSLQLAQTQNDQPAQLRALLNAIPLYSRTNASETATQAWEQAFSLLITLPNSREKVYAAIDLANLLSGEPIPKTACLQPNDQPTAIRLLQQALSMAQNLHDNRAQSFALGELGHIYECRQDYEIAQDLTQQARWTAEQDFLAKDSLYLWEWQTARLLNAQGQSIRAIKGYEQAIATLETIRGDILTANRDVQFDFRDTVEPIYRELVELRLEQDLPLRSTNPKEQVQNITAALSTVDSLKLAELQNYFGNDCVLTVVNPERVDLVGVNSPTVIFNSILFQDRTAIIASFPNGQKRLVWLAQDSEHLRKAIIEFRIGLERFYDEYNPQPAQQLYDWLIRPFAADLEQAQIKTLVFVHDGLLRSIPMAALHDGEKFLIETYAIATTPSLTLTDPTALNRQSLRALILGLTQRATIDKQPYEALKNVGLEVEKVKTQLPGSKSFLDSEFTRDRLYQELSQTVYPILHIATHGEFGAEPENTFLVTGNNQKLTINELQEIIRTTTNGQDLIDVLALTACQTAIGDDRATLGLAGVAVQAGASSALASLWFVDDATTAKIATQFYAQLRNSQMNKAEALRAAQLAIIEGGGVFSRPGYWAPFILIGNWL